MGFSLAACHHLRMGDHCEQEFGMTMAGLKVNNLAVLVSFQLVGVIAPLICTGNCWEVLSYTGDAKHDLHDAL